MITLVTDLDGTIAFGGRRPAAPIRRMLEHLVRAGQARVVLATARTPRCIEDWFGAFGRQLDVVCCNGALTVLGGRLPGTAPNPAVRWPIPSAGVAHLVDRLSSVGADYCVEYGPWFVATSAHALPWWGAEHRRVLEPHQRPPLEGVLKVTVERTGPWAAEFAGREDVDVFPHVTGDLDIVARGVDKARALTELLTAAGTHDPVVAFGNDRNDLAMLCGADRAYVVGDGLPGLEARDHVTRVSAAPQTVAAAIREAVVWTECVRGPTVEAPLCPQHQMADAIAEPEDRGPRATRGGR